jgi:hypothetical protein
MISRLLIRSTALFVLPLFVADPSLAHALRSQRADPILNVSSTHFDHQALLQLRWGYARPAYSKKLVSRLFRGAYGQSISEPTSLSSRSEPNLPSFAPTAPRLEATVSPDVKLKTALAQLFRRASTINAGRALADAINYFPEKRGRFDVDWEGDVELRLPMKHEQLVRIFAEALGNAFDAQPAGLIHVRLRREGNETVLTIQNAGQILYEQMREKFLQAATAGLVHEFPEGYVIANPGVTLQKAQVVSLTRAKAVADAELPFVGALSVGKGMLAHGKHGFGMFYMRNELAKAAGTITLSASDSTTGSFVTTRIALPVRYPRFAGLLALGRKAGTTNANSQIGKTMLSQTSASAAIADLDGIVAEEAIRMAIHIQEAGFKTLVLGGGSAEGTHLLIQAAWSRLYPRQQMPTVLILGPEENYRLYRDYLTHEVRTEFIDTTLARKLSQEFFQENAAGKLMRAVRMDRLAGKAVGMIRLRSMKKQRVGFVDDVSLTGQKFLSVKAYMRNAGFSNLQAAFFFAYPSTVLENSPDVYLGRLDGSAAESLHRWNNHMSPAEEKRKTLEEWVQRIDLIAAAEALRINPPTRGSTADLLLSYKQRLLTTIHGLLINPRKSLQPLQAAA